MPPKGFLDPLTDTAFKRLFKNRSTLLLFLNAILPNDTKVAEVETVAKVVRSAPSSPVSQRAAEATANTGPSTAAAAGNAPHQGITTRPRGNSLDVQLVSDEDVGLDVAVRLVRYDIVAVTNRNEVINVEMQRARQAYFLDRSVYHSSRLVVRYSGHRGTDYQRDIYAEVGGRTRRPSRRRCRDYRCNRVFVIAVCDFDLGRLDGIPDTLHDKWLLWLSPHWDTVECLPSPAVPVAPLKQEDPVIRYCYVSLPGFRRVETSTPSTPIARIFWLLANVNPDLSPDELPSWIEEDAGASQLLECLVLQSLEPGERKAYEMELEAMYTHEQELERREQRGFEKGLEEARQEARQKLRCHGLDPSAYGL